jgi:uroporphyrinogen decarboxylase
MQRRERLELTIAGEKPDRIPVALWRHFPGDDQRAADFARALIVFQEQWDFDFLKVTPANTSYVVDYGLGDQWVGSLDGTRQIHRRVVNRSLDWTELRRIEAGRGSYGQQIETLQRLSDHFGGDVPLVYEIISPLAQAELLAGRELVLQNMRTRPERLKTGLNIITENTLRLIDGLRTAGIDGVFYHVGLASHHIMSEAEYQDVGCPYDQKLLGSLPENWWLNTVFVEGSSPMLGIAAQYPAQVLSWDDRESNVSLADGKTGFNGAVCGGLGRWNPMHNGMPGEVRDQALDAIEQTYGRRFILSTPSPLIITSPQANIRSARQVVEDMAR